jgi:hypothetical protein
MLRRDLFTALPATLLLGSMATAHAKRDHPALSLSIAVGKRFGTKRSIEYRDPASHFTVVLRNESD